MLKPIFTVKLLLISVALWAQFNTDYTPITYTGTVPAAFLESAKAKSDAEIAANDKEVLSKKQGKEFYVVQNYALSSLFTSGVIYFNDELTAYVNKVADKLLANQPEIRSKVNFYVTRSQVPNAFAWRDGSLFINIGLLNYLENEAQLAFIMSHEIEHFLAEHALLRYKKNKDIEKDIFKRKDEEESIMKMLKYSRENELDADEGGFSIYLKSDYDPREAVRALELLGMMDDDKYADQLDLIALLSTEAMQVDSSWICTDEEVELDTEKDSKRKKRRDRNTVKHQYEESDDEDEEEEYEDMAEEEDDEDLDPFSTHPSVKKRTKEMTEAISKLSDTTGATYLVGEAEFKKIKNIVSFEIVNEYRKDADYFRSLYEALQLQKQYPDNLFLKETIARNLFWISYYFDLKSIDELMEDYEQYEGQAYGRFLCFFDYMDDDDMIDLSMAYLDQLHKENPESDDIAIALARTMQLNKKKRDAKDIYKDFEKEYPDSKHGGFAKSMKNRKKL